MRGTQAGRDYRFESGIHTGAGGELLPPIPERLTRIDTAATDEHIYLEADDVCYCVWEYTAGVSYEFGPANRLISNLKIKPTEIIASPPRARYKRKAMSHCATALRCLILPAWVGIHGTFVPMPGSKIADHRDHDDRIECVLQAAFAGLNPDIRPMLAQTVSTLADHETDDRLSYAELMRLIRVSPAQAAGPPRANIAVVDDVLSSGKHFKVAQAHLSRSFPGVPVTGIFLARCVRAGRPADEPTRPEGLSLPVPARRMTRRK